MTIYNQLRCIEHFFRCLDPHHKIFAHPVAFHGRSVFPKVSVDTIQVKGRRAAEKWGSGRSNKVLKLLGENDNKIV